MPRNKPRLQLALYARPKHPDAPHFALFVCAKLTSKSALAQTPESLRVSKYHVKNTLHVVEGAINQPWRYEHQEVPDVRSEARLLVRITIAKVVRADELDEVMHRVPIYQADDADAEKAAAFDCKTWVSNALRSLEASGITDGPKGMEWEEIRSKALAYMERKKEMGRWNSGGSLAVPIWDMKTGVELLE